LSFALGEIIANFGCLSCAIVGIFECVCVWEDCCFLGGSGDVGWLGWVTTWCALEQEFWVGVQS